MDDLIDQMYAPNTKMLNKLCFRCIKEEYIEKNPIQFISNSKVINMHRKLYQCKLSKLKKAISIYHEYIVSSENTAMQDAMKANTAKIIKKIVSTITDHITWLQQRPDHNSEFVCWKNISISESIIKLIPYIPLAEQAKYKAILDDKLHVDYSKLYKENCLYWYAMLLCIKYDRKNEKCTKKEAEDQIVCTIDDMTKQISSFMDDTKALLRYMKDLLVVWKNQH